VVPNGVDIEKFESVGKNIQFRLSGKPTILYVGRLAYWKGLQVLVRAMPFILKEIPNAHLIIAGKGYMDGFIRMLSRSLNLEDYVTMLGFIPNENLPELYASSSLFVMPSLYCESFGVPCLRLWRLEDPL